ncbi:MAG: LuxR C-terminal-related transcriptional regulator [Bacteroidota bacterium]
MDSAIVKNKSLLLYAGSLAVLMLLLKWLEYRLVIINYSFEIYIGSIALIFTLLGIWLALKLAKPKKEIIIIEKTVEVSGDRPFEINSAAIETMGLSKRELEVLQLMSNGLSNIEIAERLFVSLSTVKTHSSNLFQKMDVKRRTQAIEKAKSLNIIE